MTETPNRAYTSFHAVEITGKTPDKREDKVFEDINRSECLVIDGRDIGSWEEFVEAVTGNPDGVLIQSDFSNKGGAVAILEFNSLDEDTQTSVAQLLKGYAENAGVNEKIAVTAREKESLVGAEFDLNGRVHSIDIGDQE